MKRIYHKYKSGKGFTLLEMLIVVAILVILMAIGIVSLVTIRKNLRQKQLDYMAELVYMAAQNNLVSMSVDEGNYDQYKLENERQDVHQLTYIPVDCKDKIQLEESSYPTVNSICYTCSWSGEDDNNTAKTLVPESLLSAEVWQGDWVIEYAPNEAFVYAVYYSEASSDSRVRDYGTDTNNPFRESLRDKVNRLRDNAQVGYYGGDVAVNLHDRILEPDINVYNEEALVAYISCVSLDGNPVAYEVSVTDGTNTDTISNLVTTQVGNVYVCEVVLDSLESDATRFHSVCPTLDPGANIKIEITAKSENAFIDNKTCSREYLDDGSTPINSLYASRAENSSAVTIACARHLQNLDKDAFTGHLDAQKSITTAQQVADISFRDDDITELNWFREDWYTCYDNRDFDPIDNDYLTEYTALDGTVTYSITGLHMSGSSAAVTGLFGTVKTSATRSLTISDVTLIGVRVDDGRYTGSLVGDITGTGSCTVQNCISILDKRTDLKGKDSSYVWLDGTMVGGLAGHISRGSTLTLKSSCAASVVGSNGNAQYAGGLVGYCAGNLSVDNSYADCYLAAKYTGGLVGYSMSGTNISLLNSYAAGYQGATGGAAGLVYGPATLLRSCYTVCWYSDTAETVKKYATVTNVKNCTVDTVYYMAGFPTGAYNESDSGSTAYGRQLTYAELSGSTTFLNDEGTAQVWLASALGDAFTNLPRHTTTAYNLRDQALNTYVYPSLDLAHYGDWNASFESGGLVYYEIYSGSTTPGIYGANMNTLSDKTVVGDGYGAVYLKSDYQKIKSITFTVGSGSAVQASDTTWEFRDSLGTEYVLVSMPAELTNAAPASGSYWQKITVTADSVADTYYYNPHFAKAIESALEGGTLPDAPAEVSIRSARQLYNLSLYYDNYQYSGSTANSTVYDFAQELDIDYTTYQWGTYASHTTVSYQDPIGWTGSSYVAFLGEYDGGCHTISGISFNNGTCTGFVAQNRGRLVNIVLAAEYADNRSLSLDQSRASDDCYVGVLAARNLSGGSIVNCAVAGYAIKVNAYRDSAVYAGGLVGYNQGSILSCSAECPVISLTIDNSNVMAGGFAGRNGGSISSCYAISSINLKENSNSTSKNVVLAGFCAQNGPTLQNSYCCTSFTINNDSTSLVYNFAPLRAAGQTLNDCYYLSGGTFRFVGSTYTYNENNTQPGGGEKIGYLKLDRSEAECISMDGFGTTTGSYYCRNTTDWEGSTVSFPFPTSVKNASGSYVHYGDWVTGISNASAGVFYWEYESGGDNPGYYVSFTFDDTNLCTVHDDGGVVTQFGYGYYTKNSKITDSSVSLTMTGFSSATEDSTVNGKLKELMPGYTFHAYVTGTGSGQLYLTGSGQNGTWTLNIAGTKESYAVCPFFANALSLSSEAAPGSASKPYQIRSVAQLQYINWNASAHNCKTDVSSSNYKNYPYLQYTTVSTTGNGKQDSDSVYAQRPKQYWTQTHDIGNSENDTDFWPIAGTSTGATDVYSLYYNGAFNAVLYNWFGGSFDGGSYKMINLHISSELNNVAIFGYTCDADMHNIILYSNRSTVIERVTSSTYKSYGGLNAATVPENSTSSYAIGGLVGIAYDYYSFDEDGNAIKDSNTGTDGAGTPNTISNCAIAGYSIQDNCRNSRISCGDVNIGGLFGIANANILNCSAVVDIIADCTFDYFSTCGNTVRVGGIAGCCPYKLDNCYSGGSISLGENALYAIENEDGLRPVIHTGYNVLNESNAGNFYFTHYYVAGICAGNFGGNFMNFTNMGYVSTWDSIIFYDNAREVYGKTIEQSFSNCYTYMNLVDVAASETFEGYDEYDGTWHTCSIGLMDTLAIGGVPERVDANGKLFTLFDDYTTYILIIPYKTYSEVDGHVTITNCWYLDSCVTLPKHRPSGIDAAQYALGVRYVSGTDSRKDTATGGAMTLAQMSDTGDGGLLSKLASAGYESVTTYENQNSQYVGGKYSFPGENKTLLGTVYPFPTIVTQKNAYNEDVHVHYGSWPTGAIMFEEYYVSTDILKDGNTVELSLKLEGDLSDLTPPTLTYTDENGEALAEGVITLAVTGTDNPYYDTETGDWVYTLKLNETGVFIVKTAELGTDKLTAECQLTVTGSFEISAEPVNVTYGQVLSGFAGYENELSCVKLNAGYSEDEKTTVDLLAGTHAEDIHWTISYEGYEDIVSYYKDGSDDYTDETAVREISFSGGDSITGTIFNRLSAGDAVVQVTAKYCPEGWNGDTPKGLVLTAEYSFEIPVWSKTVIGIANTADAANPVYCEISHKEPDESTMTGERVEYYSAAPQMDDETLFLYCSGTKAELADFLAGLTDSSVTVTGGSQDYTLILPTAEQIVTIGGYQVAPITLNHGDTAEETNSYTISLDFTKTAAYAKDGKEQSKSQSYTLSVDFSESGCTSLLVDFAATLDGQKTVLSSLLVPYGQTVQSQLSEELKLPDPPTNYQWAEGSTWTASGSITLDSSLTKNTVFTRNITGQTYTFHFYRATNTAPADATATYGVTRALPVYSSLSIAQTGDDFYGWQVLNANMEVMDGLVIDDDGAELSYVLEILESLIENGETEFRLLAITTLPTTESEQPAQNGNEAADTENSGTEATPVNEEPENLPEPEESPAAEIEEENATPATENEPAVESVS